MKRLQQCTVKTKILSRRGNYVVRTPLVVQKEIPKSNAQLDLLLDEPFELEGNSCDRMCDDSANTQRNISAFCNWEKLRPQLLTSHLEQSYLRDSESCIVCLKESATIRCTYCGPRQYFCQSCANSQHERRNQFHVMEKWEVYTVYILYDSGNYFASLMFPI